MAAKRVFILGAGFSKQAGMPLATELTPLILDGTELRGLDDLQAWLADFRERLAAAEDAAGNADGFVLNVEQLFDFAQFDAELWRMRQQLCPVGRRHGPDTAWNKAEDIKTWLGYAEEELPHVIWDAQQKANLGPIQRFTDQLRPDDVVITFNYDTLVESVLSSDGKRWNHGLDDKDNGGVPVLKMHGSVDWIQLERRSEKELEKFVKLFSKTDRNVEDHGSQPPSDEEEHAWELWRAKGTETCNAVIGMDKCGLSNFDYRRGLAGLGRYKPLHRLPGSGPTWLAGFEALKNADELYVVGFSMSPYDTMTRFHFTSVIRSRSRLPERAVVIDPNADELKDVMSVVFGQQPELIASAAQDVDWQQVLG